MRHAITGALAFLLSTSSLLAAPAQTPEQIAAAALKLIRVDYRLLPASTPSRQPRELMKLSGRTQEIQRLIGRALRAVTDLGKLGERQVKIDCDVIQADGGTRTAAITGAFVALSVAVQGLLKARAFTKIPILSNVAAVSCGITDLGPVLDLDYPEDVKARADANFVMTSDGRLVEVQGTAEAAPFSRQELDKLLDLAAAGTASLVQLQNRAIHGA